MKMFLTLKLLFFSSFICMSQQHGVLDTNIRADIPPSGWNSYDSFSWTINEKDFLDNARLVSQNLKSSGYEVINSCFATAILIDDPGPAASKCGFLFPMQYVVVDYLWYRQMMPGAHADSLGFDVIDEWGRMVPDPKRWPSSVRGKGFAAVAQQVHEMGLKFGIHVMRGISTQAVNGNTPILDITTGGTFQQGGKNWTAREIGRPERRCPWMPNGFMAVDTSSDAGKAFLWSLYWKYFEWGVDFVKLDCVFGEDLDLDEIAIVSQAIATQHSTVIFSVSPGKLATPEMASKTVSGLVNMYRVTGDDWDTWADISSHFDVARDFAAAGLIGAKGLAGKSWPDLDMLPLGWLTEPASNNGPHRKCRLTPDEQKTQVTLWSIAKSPLMFGGDMRNLDYYTHQLLTEPTLLQINSYSSNNKEIATSTPNLARSWVATGNQGETYVAYFNLHDKETLISGRLVDLLPQRNLTGVCKGKEAWSGRDLGVVQGTLQANISSHGVALFVLHCNK